MPIGTDSRLRNLTGRLADRKLAVVLVGRPQNVRYLSGWSATLPGAIVLNGSAAILIAPWGTGADQAAATAGLELIEYHSYSASELVDAQANAAEQFREAVREAGLRDVEGRIGTDLAIWDPTSSAVDVGSMLQGLRRIKDESEVAMIRDRVSRLEAAFGVACDAIRPGLTEAALLAAVHETLQSRTQESLRLDANLGSGPRSALADPHATQRILNDGDLVLVDLYPELDGMVADLTRTFVVGHATRLQEDRWAVVREALAAAESILVPGTPVRQVDQVVRETLRRAGTGELPHHVGHGIGIDAWEAPWVGSGSDDILEVGDVIAIEPGLYVEAWGGMRLEANYVIQASGPERLDTFPETLTGR